MDLQRDPSYDSPPGPSSNTIANFNIPLAEKAEVCPANFYYDKIKGGYRCRGLCHMMTDASSHMGGWYKAAFFSQPGGFNFQKGALEGQEEIEIGGGIWGKLGWKGPFYGPDQPIETILTQMNGGLALKRDPDRRGAGAVAMTCDPDWCGKNNPHERYPDIFARETTGDEMLQLHHNIKEHREWGKKNPQKPLFMIGGKGGQGRLMYEGY
jgi:hypothetical protein